MKNINDFFAANVVSKTQDNFATFVSGQGAIENINQDMQTIHSNNENICRECFASPILKRANLQIRSDKVVTQAFFRTCKNCGHKMELEVESRSVP
jgi:RNase P subunit RPR2